jgi:hypothetical protein
LRLATPWTVIGLLTRGYVCVNVLLRDGLNVIDSPRIGRLMEEEWLLLLPIFGDKLTRFVAEWRPRNMVDKELARIIQRSKGGALRSEGNKPVPWRGLQTDF